jgi:hypothetical protein
LVPEYQIAKGLHWQIREQEFDIMVETYEIKHLIEETAARGLYWQNDTGQPEYVDPKAIPGVLGALPRMCLARLVSERSSRIRNFRKTNSAVMSRTTRP